MRAHGLTSASFLGRTSYSARRATIRPPPGKRGAERLHRDSPSPSLGAQPRVTPLSRLRCQATATPGTPPLWSARKAHRGKSPHDRSPLARARLAWLSQRCNTTPCVPAGPALQGHVLGAVVYEKPPGLLVDQPARNGRVARKAALVVGRADTCCNTGASSAGGVPSWTAKHRQSSVSEALPRRRRPSTRASIARRCIRRSAGVASNLVQRAVSLCAGIDSA